MDPITHGLTGAVLAQAGLRQRYGYQATLATTAGALIPDIDVLWSPAGSVVALETHRGITHSFVGGLGLALALGLIVRLLGPEKRWRLLSGLALLGIVVGHLFLDLITSYGIQLFLPFSRSRPALDLVFIIDPFLTLPLLGALVAGYAWRSRSALIGRVAVGIMAGYLGLMAVNHLAAVSTLDRIARSQGIVPRRVEALPEPFTPFRWRGFVEDGDTYWQGIVALGRAQGRLTPIPKGPRNGPVARAEEVEAVKTFLWFARFPVVIVREEGARQVVEYQDLRFAHSFRRRPAFLLRVILGPGGVVEQVLLNP
ncbi:MAG: metal-dependent hydrolase [Candidatus Rokubacteria bacterium]|nr:metal-dependent hydrolase [Candidatus Rokubacteria bacterium]